MTATVHAMSSFTDADKAEEKKHNTLNLLMHELMTLFLRSNIKYAIFPWMISSNCICHHILCEHITAKNIYITGTIA